MLLYKIPYPYQCVYCEKELNDNHLCDNCLDRIKILKDQVCPVCEKSSPYGNTHQLCKKNTPLNGVFAATDYKDEITRKLIHMYKYKFIKSLENTLLTILLKGLEINNTLAVIENKGAIITSVPLHPIRQRWRGFNQSQIIAQNLPNHLNSPYIDLLTRVKNNKPQKDIDNTISRQQNVKYAFKIKKGILNEEISNKTIFIVDDIATTLSTLNECAKELATFQPKQIYAIVISKKT